MVWGWSIIGGVVVWWLLWGSCVVGAGGGCVCVGWCGLLVVDVPRDGQVASYARGRFLKSENHKPRVFSWFSPSSVIRPRYADRLLGIWHIKN